VRKLRDRRGKRILLEGQIRGLMTIASEMGVFLLPPDPKAWAIYDRKGVKIFPQTGGADLSEIARHFLTMPSQHPVDDWGDSLE
jgi:hypothetical protein